MIKMIIPMWYLWRNNILEVYKIQSSKNTLILTSPALGGATSTCSKLRGLLGSHATAARHVIVCIFTKKMERK